MKIPVKGEIWEHTKTGNRYEIIGGSFNAITEVLEIAYKPLYPCDYHQFTRQLKDHPKAWNTKNDEGNPRFRKVS